MTAELAKRLCEFLELGGAEILPITNPFELARFKTVNGVCVIYQNKKGGLSYSNEHAKVAASHFLDGKSWNASKRHQRIQRQSIEGKLLERDGNACFYCGVDFSEEIPPTLEHILSITHGGTNNIANLCLCCEPCNVAAGNLSIVEKLKLRKVTA